MSPAQLLQGYIVSDQGGSTATLEAHPSAAHLGLSVSLHPCQHAAAMSKLTEGKPGHVYLSLFLKIVASSVPLLALDTLAA